MASSVSDGRIDLPSDPRDLASVPASLGRRFLVFVDTEEEFDWTRPRERTATATTAIAALPETHRGFVDRGVHPTYLVDYPIASDPAAIAALRPMLEAGECAIGTQLHPWVNPPFDEELTVANSFAGNLPEATERAKLDALTHRIETAFGKRPTIYRAGRYGVGPRTARLLEESGYRLDVSVRARFDYSSEGGPNFSYHSPAASWIGPTRALLELPLTAIYVGPARRLGPGLYPAAKRILRMRGLLSRTGILNRIALTPEGTPIADAVRAIRTMLDDGERLLSFSFHSPSLVPGNTPYVRDAAGLRRFHAWWDGVLSLLAREGVDPIGADAFVDAMRAARGAPRRLASDGADGLSAGRAGGL